MLRILKRRIVAAAVVVGLSMGAGLVAASPASAASAAASGAVTVVSPPPANICLYGDCTQQTFCSHGTCVPGPPPACVSGYCIPQTPVSVFGSWIPQAWYVATSVTTNEGLYRIGNPVVGDNPTPVDNPSCVNLAQTVSGTLTATLQGTFGVHDPAAISGAVAEIQPGVSASVGYTYTFSGSAPCPPETNTTIYFGIGYVQTTGTVYSLSVSGQITSQSGVVATVPTGWAYYTQYTPAVYSS
jgi:hypothetical protein